MQSLISVTVRSLLGLMMAKNSKTMISAMQAHKMLSNRCMGFLASVVDKRKEEKLDPTIIPVVKDFMAVFLEELLGLPPEWEISFEIELLH